jgi:hypothetical protein
MDAARLDTLDTVAARLDPRRSMSPSTRKLLLTSHVAVSVAWLGAVAAFLTLAITGLASANDFLVRAVCMSMDVVGWYVIVPLCFASLLTGLIEGLATPWGLLRHYWVVMKLSATTVLTLLLMVHMQPTGQLAAAAAQTNVSGAGLHAIQMQLAVDAGSAAVALLVVVALAIVKPRGLTRRGVRMQQAESRDAAAASSRMPRWAIVMVAVAVISLIAVRTLTGAGHHG